MTLIKLAMVWWVSMQWGSYIWVFAKCFISTTYLFLHDQKHFCISVSPFQVVISNYHANSNLLLITRTFKSVLVGELLEAYGTKWQLIKIAFIY